LTPYSPSVSCVLKGQNLKISYYTIIYNIREKYYYLYRASVGA